MKLLALGRLLRLSLAPTAIADVLAGLLLGAGGHWPAGRLPWLLIGATLGVYHGAMALNDWADRAEDAQTRPDRPIPSGVIPAPVALAIGLGLVTAGIVAASIAHQAMGLWMGIVGLLAIFYDLAGRGALRGPLLLALCRAGNLAAGTMAPVFMGIVEWHPLRLAPALLYGAYVFFVSRLGRLEDGEDRAELGSRPARYLMSAGICLALVGLLPTVAIEGALVHWPSLMPVADSWGRIAAIVISGLAAAGLLRRAATLTEWTPQTIGASMGMALRRLLPFTASCALLYPVSDGFDPIVVAICILLGFPLSHALRKVFPPS
ncbi:MAG: 4-hydroxybenzoate polyprenyltransferase [Planctomycetota bacterium]|jgi:4-hydroxybenzoate polyprenyltransferase